MNHQRVKSALIFVVVLCLSLAGCASDQEKSKKFIQEGQAYLDSGEYNKAVIQLQNAVELTPQSPEGYGLLAKAYLQLGDAQKGFQNLLRQETLSPDDHDLAAQVGSFYLLARQPEEAKRRMEKVLAQDPKHAPSLFLKAGLMTQARERLDLETLERISKIYQDILDIDPAQTRAHLALARAKASLGDFDTAEIHLKKALELEPDNNVNYQTLFNFYRARKDIKAAEQVIADLIDRKPMEADPHIIMGNYHFSRRDYEKARTEYRIALEKDSNNLTPYMKLAQVADFMGEYPEAEQLLEKAVSLNPENFAVQTTLAEFYFSRGRQEQSQAILDKIMTQRPDFLPAKVLQGKLMARNNRLDEAIDIFRTLVQEEPNSPNFNFLLGKALAQNGEVAQANSAITKAIELNPTFIPARILLARNQFKSGDFFLAETHINRILDLQPKHYPANILLGNIRMASKEFNQARKIFTQLIQANPNNPLAYYRLGIVDRIERQFPAAEDRFQMALDLNPNLMDVFTSLVELFMVQKKFDQAIAACDRQLARTDKAPVVEAVALNLKGNVHHVTGKTAQATEAFQASIQANPKFIPPYRALARILMAKGESAQAIATYEALSRHAPKLAAPHSLIGTIYEQQKQLEKAETYYKKALELDTNHVPALNNLAYIYASQNRNLDQALDLARRARKNAGENPAIMDTLGWVYYQKALYDSAIQEFEACIRKSPKNPIFHYHLGLAFNKLGRMEKSRAALKRALELNPDFPGAQEARTLLNPN
ncbi:MAG: tetratricopeptide repeat protein [Desulfobacterales bacterium]|nr:tetratricopeptide repeat protein [Desulfobacterales bacterium]